jgi:hypothetical protein
MPFKSMPTTAPRAGYEWKYVDDVPGNEGYMQVPIASTQPVQPAQSTGYDGNPTNVDLKLKSIEYAM